MNLNNEILIKGSAAVQTEIITSQKVYRYISTVSIIMALALSVAYSRERELSKAKSGQLNQRITAHTEDSVKIKLLEEVNINLSKNN